MLGLEHQRSTIESNPHAADDQQPVCLPAIVAARPGSPAALGELDLPPSPTTIARPTAALSGPVRRGAPGRALSGICPNRGHLSEIRPEAGQLTSCHSGGEVVVDLLEARPVHVHAELREHPLEARTASPALLRPMVIAWQSSDPDSRVSESGIRDRGRVAGIAGRCGLCTHREARRGAAARRESGAGMRCSETRQRGSVWPVSQAGSPRSAPGCPLREVERS
ncbi:MAG TPA: hypothetical protein VFK02_00125 [Kofleriaceae bacterium]|nr:hypothetical protein [Kofleriaceae bacterium]